VNTITLDSDIEIVLRASWPELSATERRCVFLALAYGLRNAVIADYLGRMLLSNSCGEFIIRQEPRVTGKPICFLLSDSTR